MTKIKLSRELIDLAIRQHSEKEDAGIFEDDKMRVAYDMGFRHGQEAGMTAAVGEVRAKMIALKMVESGDITEAAQ